MIKTSSWLAKLSRRVKEGYVRVSEHPNLPLSIYNYTPKTEANGEWDEVTRACRGLVLDHKGRVVVNSPPKFFNHADEFAPEIDWANADITLKADGYYISITNDSEYGLIITSRGSFDNRYANAARELFSKGDYHLTSDISYFCELLQDFPGDENIIVAKHPNPELLCWAMRDQRGNELDITNSPIPTVPRFSIQEAKDYLTGEVEGVVLQDKTTKERVKWKTEWFFRMHKLISQCTKRRVWEIIKEGNQVIDQDIPDEFLQQMLGWEKEIRQAIEQYYMEAHAFAHTYESYTDKELGLEHPVPSPYDKLVWLIRKGKEPECIEQIIRIVGEDIKSRDTM